MIFRMFTATLLPMLILLSTINLIRHLVHGKRFGWLLKLSLTLKICQLGQRVAWKNYTYTFHGSINCGTEKWIALSKKSSFKMLELSLTSKMGWGSHIVSIAKVAGNVESLKFATNLEPPWNTTAMPGQVLPKATCI